MARTLEEIRCSDMAEYYVSHNTDARKRRQSGQIAVEYILLLAVGVSIAALITSLVVSRNDESPGIIILKWRAIIEMIGSDQIEK